MNRLQPRIPMPQRWEYVKLDITRLDENHLMYEGHKFFRDQRNGYYFSCRKYCNMSMHKFIWVKFNGPVPEGYEVHHKDHNKANNDIDNLEVLPIVEHRRQHQLDKIGYTGKFEGKCIHCGNPIDISFGWSIFCSKRCKQAYARINLKRYADKKICVVCGKEFIGSKYRDSPTCSNKCKNILTKERVNDSQLGEVMICEYCGKEFRSLHKASCCCIQHKRKYDRQRNKGKKPNHICQICGKQFFSEKKNARYCSKSCSGKGRTRVSK